MTPYLNRSGNSGVAAYEIEEHSIVVRFKNGGTYLYNDSATGQKHIETMKKLAISGSGLGTYISKYVGKAYAAKLS